MGGGKQISGFFLKGPLLRREVESDHFFPPYSNAQKSGSRYIFGPWKFPVPAKSKTSPPLKISRSFTLTLAPWSSKTYSTGRALSHQGRGSFSDLLRAHQFQICFGFRYWCFEFRVSLLVLSSSRDRGVGRALPWVKPVFPEPLL